jgi:outer membrane protein OmpA-like peptidoglycan-associated protein
MTALANLNAMASLTKEQVVSNLAARIAQLDVDTPDAKYDDCYRQMGQSKSFAEVLKQQYPKLFLKYDDPNTVIDVSYVRNISEGQKELIAQVENTEFKENSSINNTVSFANLSIEFFSSLANFTPAAITVFEDLHRSIIVADNLYIFLAGHTDNTRTDGVNIPLLEQCTQTVKSWLQQKNSAKYPNSRFTFVQGFGSTTPITDNTAASGKQKNRRVIVFLGN